MRYKEISIATEGERFYEITEQVEEALRELLAKGQGAAAEAAGLVHLWNPHTSCALTVSEAYDPSARKDLEAFLRHLAPRSLPFITHTAEGPDDSPSHMKAILMQPFLLMPFAKGALELGQWQGVYLTEFREGRHRRTLRLSVLLG